MESSRTASEGCSRSDTAGGRDRAENSKSGTGRSTHCSLQWERTQGARGLAAGEGDMKTLTLMANGIYALDQGGIQSYIGAGVGIARHKFTYKNMAIAAGGEVVAGNIGESDNDTVFAYQAMAGVEFPVTERVDGRLGYRYFRTADADIEGDDIGYAMHNFEAGLIMRF